jgi:DNA-binding XRE family transcriptional regulator
MKNALRRQTKMDDFTRHKNEMLKDSEFKEEYDKLDAEYAVIAAIIDARISLNLTQSELAKRTGIRQSNISRLEKGTYNPSLKTLRALADGMGKKLHIEFR